MRLTPFNAPFIGLAAIVFVLAGLYGILFLVRLYDIVNAALAGSL